ncbi:hypothetical protein E2C01_019385 [Portunus trituberculatus]|uniref:Uncharacterized protein n=1 Tax=Portunus trituberculatus TaxID=210409 RepID=A0A5B7DYQ7_PORTR|nr:hypothetical protein [Portunus trituberculatus]
MVSPDGDPKLTARLVGAVVGVIFFAVKQSRKMKYTPNQSTGPDQSTEPDTGTLYTISATPRLSFLQVTQPRPPHLRQPLPQETHTSTIPPTNRPPSFSTTSLSSQLSHAYYTHSSSFSSLSPYIASVSVEGRHHNTFPSLRTPSVTLGINASDAAQDAGRQAANQSPPAYVEVVDDDMDPPSPPTRFHTTAAAGGSNGQVFGPSSDGLPSYETVVATRQTRGDDPPPYTPS